jgi:hypothetical protein
MCRPSRGHVSTVARLIALVAGLLGGCDFPRDPEGTLDRVEDAVRGISDLDRKLQDVVVSVVREIDGAPEDLLVRGARGPGVAAPTT